MRDLSSIAAALTEHRSLTRLNLTHNEVGEEKKTTPLLEFNIEQSRSDPPTLTYTVFCNHAGKGVPCLALMLPTMDIGLENAVPQPGLIASVTRGLGRVQHCTLT